jgi:energy-coupling factor transporter ATP-binding protein EcfA2
MLLILAPAAEAGGKGSRNRRARISRAEKEARDRIEAMSPEEREAERIRHDAELERRRIQARENDNFRILVAAEAERLRQEEVNSRREKERKKIEQRELQQAAAAAEEATLRALEETPPEPVAAAPAASAPLAAALAPNPRSGKHKVTQINAKKNKIVEYLTDNLRVTMTDKFILTESVWDELMAAAPDARRDQQNWMTDRITPGAADIAKRSIFSRYQAEVIGEIFRGLAAPSLGNVLVSGPAGVGKSHLLKALTLLISEGVFPDYMLPAVGVPEGRTLEQDAEGAFAMQRREIFGSTLKSMVVNVNYELLTQDPTTGGQAMASASQRPHIILQQLLAAARQEFRATGRRTFFVFEEIAALAKMDPMILQTMKSLIDRTGIRNPANALARAQDMGYGAVFICTDAEAQKLSGGDSAIDRRTRRVQMVEPSTEVGFNILQDKVVEDYGPTFGGLSVTDEALRYIVHMRRFFDNPPQAMPGNIIKGLEDFYMWAMHGHHRSARAVAANELNLEDVQNFMKDRLSLTDIWFEQHMPDGTVIPALEGLEACVKSIVKGQDEAVGIISQKYTAWARMGFSSTVPVFALGGPSGSGKDTLFAAFNLCLFGHEGGAFQFDIAGQKGFGLTAILRGPPIGNHADDELPHLAQALDKGVSSMIALNEAQDISAAEMELLKKFFETGEIRPQGQDNRVRNVYFPIWLIGQWGEWFFRDEITHEPIRDEARIDEIYRSLGQDAINRAFMEGKRIFGTEVIGPEDERYNQFGALPEAVIQRIIMTGAVVMLRPVSTLVYPNIVRIKAEKFKRDALTTNNLTVNISDALINYIADVAEATNQGTRGMHSITMDFTQVALSVAMGLGMPGRGITVSLDIDLTDRAQPTVIVRQEGGRTFRLNAARLRTMKVPTCIDALSPAEHAVFTEESTSGLKASEILPTTQE